MAQRKKESWTVFYLDFLKKLQSLQGISEKQNFSEDGIRNDLA